MKLLPIIGCYNLSTLFCLEGPLFSSHPISMKLNQEVDDQILPPTMYRTLSFGYPSFADVIRNPQSTPKIASFDFENLCTSRTPSRNHGLKTCRKMICLG